MIYPVYKIEWTEYERGWGQRPDGTSYHKDLKSAEDYIKEYNLKYNSEPNVPECYSIGSKPTLIEVDYKTFKEVNEKGMLWK